MVSGTAPLFKTFFWNLALLRSANLFEVVIVKSETRAAIKQDLRQPVQIYPSIEAKFLTATSQTNNCFASVPPSIDQSVYDSLWYRFVNEFAEDEEEYHNKPSIQCCEADQSLNEINPSVTSLRFVLLLPAKYEDR